MNVELFGAVTTTSCIVGVIVLLLAAWASGYSDRAASILGTTGAVLALVPLGALLVFAVASMWVGALS